MRSAAAVRVVHASQPTPVPALLRRRAVGRSITDSLALIRTSSAPFCSPSSAATASAVSRPRYLRIDPNTQHSTILRLQPTATSAHRPTTLTRLLTDKA